LRLFLDDDPARADAFLNRFPDAHWVQTVQDCIAALADKTWDEVHLDHDLEGEWFVDSERKDCGMEVVRWLTSEPRTHLMAAKFVVHTHNHNAAMVMVTQLGLAGYFVLEQPFGSAREEVAGLGASPFAVPEDSRSSNRGRAPEPLKDEEATKPSIVKRILRWFVPPPSIDTPWNSPGQKAIPPGPDRFRKAARPDGWGGAQAVDVDEEADADEPGPYVFPIREDEPDSLRGRNRRDDSQ
jgi:hypothetical protein